MRDREAEEAAVEEVQKAERVVPSSPQLWAAFTEAGSLLSNTVRPGPEHSREALGLSVWVCEQLGVQFARVTVVRGNPDDRKAVLEAALANAIDALKHLKAPEGVVLQLEAVL